MATLKVLTPKQLAFVEAFMKSGNAEQSAIVAGYSKGYAERQAYSFLRNPKIQAVLAAKPVQLSDDAVYTREKAMKRFDRAYEKAMEINRPDIAKEIVESEIRLHGLSADPVGNQGQGGVTINNLVYGRENEWYEFMKRKEAAGHGIDTDSIGRDIAPVAVRQIEDRRQAEPTGPANA